MQRYRFAPGLPAATLMALLLGGCAIPGPRENAGSVASLVAGRTGAMVEWRRDADADAAARAQVEALLAEGITLDNAVTAAFLAGPLPQLALEQLEVSRAELVAAITPPNPVGVIGSRKPGGDLAAFYPESSISFGILQNVMALLVMPDGKAIAEHELQRARYETADQLATHATQVVQAWLEYSAATLVLDLRERRLAAAQAALDMLAVQAGRGEVDEADLQQEHDDLSLLQREAVRLELDASARRNRLAELIGLGGWHDDWQILASLPAPPEEEPQELAELEQLALTQRFDLQASAKSIDTRLRLLSSTRRFRWLNQLEIGLFRDKAIGGTSFTGPNAVVEVPLFDQRQADLLAADAELRSALRRLEGQRQTALSEIRNRAAELQATRLLLDLFEQGLSADHAAVVDSEPAADLAQLERLIGALAAEEERAGLLREYWRARTSLAHAAGGWGLDPHY